MKKILVFTILSVFSFFLFGQKSENVSDINKKENKDFVSVNTFAQSKALMDYEFSENVGTFTSISSTGTALTPSNWDDGYYDLDLSAEGFSFLYNENLYSSMSINTNGAMRFGASAFNTSSNDLASTSNYTIVAPLWDDMCFYGAGIGDGIFYQLDGSGSTQVLTIEWNNIARYGYNTFFVSFQIKLFEETGEIQIIYSDMSLAINWDATVSIGINDNESSTVFLSVTPGSPTTVSNSVSNNTIDGATISAIATGTVYSFVPNVADVHDLAVISITPVSGQTPITPLVTISNFGTYTETVWSVNLTDGNGYDETINDYEAIAPNGSSVVTFPEWSPTSGVYTLTATVTVADDADLTNNELTQSVNAYSFEDVIFEQHQLVTNPGEGYNGADVSMLQSTSLGMSTLGGGFQIASSNSMADDFTVPEGQEWTIVGFMVYAYQTGSTNTSTLTDVLIRVYDGDPMNGGSIIYDFWAGSNLVATDWTSIYRATETDILATNRPIMYGYCSVPQFTLTAGTYWVEFSVDGTLTSGPWCPPITILGETKTGNAIQNIDGTWQIFEDSGTHTQQGIPFDIYGSIVVYTYTVTFTVSDGTNPLENANVNINGNDLKTDVYGVATIELEYGTYSYTVSLDGYYDQTGQVIVNAAGVYENVVLEPVSINELNAEILVNPNPTNGVLNISANQNFEVEITDLTGKVLKSAQMIGNKTEFDLSGFESGIYLIRFYNENGIQTVKVVKK